MNFNYDDLTVFLKIFVLLYADDTIIFGMDEKNFQDNLNLFFEYSEIWKLDINFSKTEVMIFGTRSDDKFEFKLGDNVLSICKEFKYLGVVFSKSRSFYKAIKNNLDQARKAMHLLYKRIRNLKLPIDLQIQLFDHTIVPILLYGSEVWGYQNTQILENLHNEFLRNILNLRKSTPIYMLHTELGRWPLQINIKKRMIGYWISIINGKQSKLSKLLYNILLNEFNAGIYEHKWIKCIKEILISVGKYNLFSSEFINNPKAVIFSIGQTLLDLYIQDWNNRISESFKGKNYSVFKNIISLEPYLIYLPRSFYLPLCKFRTGNHKLPIETGRWENIPLNERMCILCNLDIGDEFHYLFKCPYFTEERVRYLKPYFYTRPNMIKFNLLLSTKNLSALTNLSKYVDIIMKTFT